MQASEKSFYQAISTDRAVPRTTTDKADQFMILHCYNVALLYKIAPLKLQPYGALQICLLLLLLNGDGNYAHLQLTLL